MDLDRLALFDLVLRSGSFAEAARRRGLDPSSVSRRIAALEAEVGARLIARNTRRMRPTLAGERLQAEIAPHLAALEQAAARAGGGGGVIRMTASTTFARLWLVPALADFQADHPKVRIELRATDRPLDLIDERIDIAVRHGRLTDSALVARKLRDVDYVCVGHPGQADIRSPDALRQAPHLVFDLPGFRESWSLSKGRRRESVPLRPALLSDNADALLSAARAGLGVAVLADWTVEEALRSGTLVRLMTDWRFRGPVSDPALWLVTPTRKQRPERVEALLRHLHDRLG